MMRPEYCVPMDLVFREGDVGKEMYFLVKGLLQVVVNVGTEHEEKYGMIQEGDYFGEKAIFELVRRTASIRALDFSTTFVLTRESLEMIEHCKFLAIVVKPNFADALTQLVDVLVDHLFVLLTQIIPMWGTVSGRKSRVLLTTLMVTAAKKRSKSKREDDITKSRGSRRAQFIF